MTLAIVIIVIYIILVWTVIKCDVYCRCKDTHP